MSSVDLHGQSGLKIVIPFSFRNLEESTGGVSVHVRNLAVALAQTPGIGVSIVTFGDRNAVTEESEVRIISIAKRRWYRYLPIPAVLKLSHALKSEKPSLIHIQGSYVSPYLLHSLFLVPKGMPKAITFHGYLIEEALSKGLLKEGSVKWRLARMLERLIVRRFDALICVDTRLKTNLVEKYGSLAMAKAQVILNGIDLRRFEIRPARIRPEGEVVILNAKALVPKNGQEYLIRAMPMIRRTLPKAKLRIIGEGPDGMHLRELVATLNLKEVVDFLGEIPNSDMPRQYADCDVVVIPSVRVKGVEEASSILLLEAMASGRPVVASDIGGLRESIVDGKTGLLIPDQQPEAIASSVISLATDTKRYDEVVRAARAYVEKERTWTSVAGKHLEVYRAILERQEGDVTPPRA